MVFDWLDEKKTPGLTREERFMGILFDLGMATNDQLQVITKWSKSRLSDARKTIRNMGKSKESKYEDQLFKQIEKSILSMSREKDPITENQLNWIKHSLRAIAKTEEQKDDWLRMYGAKANAAYTLGPQGVRYVADMMGRQSSYRELGPGQREHTLGMTEILARLMRAGVKPEQWLNTREASDRMARLQEDWKIERDASGNWEIGKGKRGKIIRPDGCVQIKGNWFYIEYDRGTKHGERIRDQIDDYIQLPGKIGQAIDPVIWVTGNRDRTEELRDRIYPEVIKKYPEEYPAPEMYFFTEGDETKFLIGSEPLVIPKQVIDDQSLERIQELEQERDRLARQLDEKQAELSRQNSRIEYLTNLANQNQREVEEIAAWFQGLIAHLKDSSRGFFKSSPEQALAEYIKDQGYPEKLKG